MATASPRRGNLLVAEDNLTNQTLVAAILKAAGHDVTVVKNGTEAVEAHERASFDLIFMDCHMPEMDGFEATRRIRERERHSNVTRVPIIALTGDDASEAREACLESGMDDFLSKPFERAKMTEVLSRWLPRSS
jgi:two-component system, sensor histidine kinase and response regulator